MVAQAKIDLFVLWKLYEHSEQGGDAVTPNDLARYFSILVPPRRLELALEELEKRSEVVREYHPHYFDEGLWKISRDGIATVDKALKVETTFIARLATNGDSWLESDEAKAAKLSKNARYAEQEALPTLPIRSLDQLTQPKSGAGAGVSEGVPAESVDWGKWGALAGIAAIPLAVVLWMLS